MAGPPTVPAPRRPERRRSGRGLGAAAALAVSLAGCAAPESAGSGALTITSAWNGKSDVIPVTLREPAGAGPFPAVVILHDCSGLGARSSGAPGRWADELVRRGYVVMLPDSFTPRGFPDGVCTLKRETHARRVNAFVRAADAYAALAYLRTRPEVDGRHIGVMGGSHGGSTILAAMAADAGGQALAAAKRDGFAAGVALYPGCGSRYGGWSPVRDAGPDGPVTGDSGTYRPAAPLLILAAGNDDWTPAEPCRRLARSAERAGLPVEITIYPGAHHAFDSSRPVRFVQARNGGRGATTGGNPDAWSDAIRRVDAFFDRLLKNGS